MHSPAESARAPSPLCADFVAEVADERRQLRATFEPRLWLPLAPLEAAALKRLR